MRRKRFPKSMFKLCLKKGYEEKEIIHSKNLEKNSKSKIMSKNGQIPNTPKLKVKILSIV